MLNAGVDEESWGQAIAIVAGDEVSGHPWTTNHVRIVLPISDSVPFRGRPCLNNDREMLLHARRVAQVAGVRVVPIAVAGVLPSQLNLTYDFLGAKQMMAGIAFETGGEFFDYHDPANPAALQVNELGEFIESIIHADPNDDGIPDHCICPEDCFDGDFDVDTQDLLELLAQWGGPGSCDLDGLGTVDTVDLLQLLGAWGLCAATSPLPVPQTVQDCLDRFAPGSFALDICIQGVQGGP